MSGETTRRDFLAATVGTGVGLALGARWNALWRMR